MVTPNAMLAPEKTLFDVLRDVWRAKFYMLICLILSVIVAVVFLSLSPQYYRAEMIIAPATPMGQPLSSAAKIPEGSAQVQPLTLQSNAAFLGFENMYSGVSVASFLVQDNKIQTALRADKAFKRTTSKKISAQALSEYLKKRVHSEPVSGTPLRKLIYLHPDPSAAKYMLTRMHDVTDEMIRSRMLQETDGRIAYLNTALKNAQNPSHRQSLTALLLEQERLKMLLSLDQPFAATVIEPAAASQKPRWPDPYLIYSLFSFVGLLLGFIIYGVRHHDA